MRSTGAIVLLVLFLILGLGGCWGCGAYNGLVGQDENVTRSWADVQTAYQRRADLVPNLVATVRGAAEFERETLESVVNARARATGVTVTGADLNDPQKVEQYMAAQRELGGALSRLLVVSENYPQLRATEAFRDLQAQLEGTENRINVARTRYNEAVMGYNRQVRSLPMSLFAGAMGFQPRTPFQADEAAQQAPTVDFSR